MGGGQQARRCRFRGGGARDDRRRFDEARPPARADQENEGSDVVSVRREHSLLRGDAGELIRVVLEEGVRIVFTSSGTPSLFTAELKKAGCTVVHVVAAVKHARKAAGAGCDAVVAEGFEAGGHNGVDETTTLALVPRWPMRSSIPVIAAGGIADGRGMAAALALGADGVQVGTRFAATVESSAHENYKEAVVAAGDGDTVLTLKKTRARPDDQDAVRPESARGRSGAARRKRNWNRFSAGSARWRGSSKGIWRKGNSRRDRVPVWSGRFSLRERSCGRMMEEYTRSFTGYPEGCRCRNHSWKCCRRKSSCSTVPRGRTCRARA